MPVATATFGVPFELEFELRAFAPDERDEALRLPDDELRLRLRLPEEELRPRDEAAGLPEEELRPRDEAAEDLRLDALAVLRLDALPLFGLLREADDLPRELAPLLFDEVLRLFGLEPFELVDPDFRLVRERELAWAIAPP
jgi:hypothetical protein